MEVFKQVRELVVDGSDLSAYDMDVRITVPTDDATTFEITVYNMSESEFRSITAGSTSCQVTLGWENGPASPVLVGVVLNTSVSLNRNDKTYTLEGEGASERVLSSRISDNYYEQTPDAIAADIASQVGLGAETDSVPTPITGYFSPNTDRTVQYWLNQLVDYAGEFTGDSWTVRADTGTLYFTTDSAGSKQVPALSYDSTLASIQPKTQQDQSSDQQYDFTSALDPRISQGARVAIETEEYSGTFEVLSYELKSSDISGDHELRGTVRPVGEPESYSDRTTRRGRGGATQRGNDG